MAMTRYRRTPADARARKRFGDTFVDVNSGDDARGFDVWAVEDWCRRNCGAEWSAWAHAPHQDEEDGRVVCWSRYYFRDRAQALRFRSVVGELYRARASAGLQARL